MTTTPYVDPNTIHNPSTGTSPPAAWGDAVRDGLEYLARPAGCVVVTSSDASAGNTTFTSVAFNGTDERDTDAYHDNVTNNDQIVIPTGLGGWYGFSGRIAFAANATGIRLARITVNGADTLRTCAFQTPATGLASYVPIVGELLLAAGDVVRVQGYQASGGALNMGGRVAMRLVAIV